MEMKWAIKKRCNWKNSHKSFFPFWSYMECQLVPQNINQIDQSSVNKQLFHLRESQLFQQIIITKYCEMYTKSWENSPAQQLEAHQNYTLMNDLHICLYIKIRINLVKNGFPTVKKSEVTQKCIQFN